MFSRRLGVFNGGKREYCFAFRAEPVCCVQDNWTAFTFACSHDNVAVAEWFAEREGPSLVSTVDQVQYAHASEAVLDLSHIFRVLTWSRMASPICVLLQRMALYQL